MSLFRCSGTKQIVSVLFVLCSNLLEGLGNSSTLCGPAEILMQRTELAGHNSVSSLFWFGFYLMGQLHWSQTCQNCDTVVVTLALTAAEAESEPVGFLPHCASLEWFAVSQCSMKIYLQPLPLLHWKYFERAFNLTCASNPLCRFRLSFFLRRASSCKTAATISQKNAVNFNQTVCQLPSINAGFPLCPQLPWKSLTSIIEYYYMWKTTDRYVQQVRESESPPSFWQELFFLPVKPSPVSLLGVQPFQQVSSVVISLLSLNSSAHLWMLQTALARVHSFHVCCYPELSNVCLEFSRGGKAGQLLFDCGVQVPFSDLLQEAPPWFPSPWFGWQMHKAAPCKLCESGVYLGSVTASNSQACYTWESPFE